MTRDEEILASLKTELPTNLSPIGILEAGSVTFDENGLLSLTNWKFDLTEGRAYTEDWEQRYAIDIAESVLYYLSFHLRGRARAIQNVWQMKKTAEVTPQAEAKSPKIDPPAPREKPRLVSVVATPGPLEATPDELGTDADPIAEE